MVPATGFWVMTKAFAGVQLSLAATPPTTLGTVPWQLASAETVIGAGRLVIVGAVVSATVKESVPLAGFPAASVTVTVIVCWPSPTKVPAAGTRVGAKPVA